MNTPQFHFGLFLSYLLFMIVAMPILYQVFPYNTLLDFVLWAMMVVGTWSLFPSTKMRMMIGLLITAMLGVYFLLNMYYNPKLQLLWITTHIAFTTLILLRTVHIATQSEVVDRNVIFAGASTYLMCGICIALIYYLIDVLDPTAFSGRYTEGEQDFQASGHILTFIYYSFVTLTTLGYGDIVPISAAARSISMAEAILGQLFIAVILGQLVSHRVQASFKPGFNENTR